MSGFVEESSLDTTEVKQIKANAIADYQEEQEVEADERFAGDISLELEDLADEMSYYSVFADKLENVNGALVEQEMEYQMGGEFDTELELGELQELSSRAERAFNSSIGTTMEPIARAFKQSVDNVVLDYSDQLL